ncbi:MAG TPA: LamG domain-containing protein [Kofleriaceae bacterium]|jgi:hypothetical protein
MLLILVGACGFMPQSGEVQPDAQSGSGSSTPPPQMTTDASFLTPCHSQLPGVVLCLDFEDSALDPIARDSSGGDHDAATSNVTPIPRGAQQAAMVTSNSSITVPQSSALDLAGPLSIELWIEAPASDQDDIIFQHDNGFGVDFNHAPGCFVNHSSDVWAPSPLAAGWHHVACTWDGSTIHTYVDGAIVACAGMHTSLQAKSARVEISMPFSGSIDDIHLYNRALEPPEVQLLAGTISTAITCP